MGDKAYGSGEIRTFLRKRNKIERLVGRVKEFRRIATRYEKRAANYLAMWFIGIILLGCKCDWIGINNFADTA